MTSTIFDNQKKHLKEKPKPTRQPQNTTKS